MTDGPKTDGYSVCPNCCDADICAFSHLPRQVISAKARWLLCRPKVRTTAALQVHVSDVSLSTDRGVSTCTGSSINTSSHRATCRRLQRAQWAHSSC